MSYFVKMLNSKMQSAQADFIPKKYVVTYKQHEWVYPVLKNSKLFVLGEITHPRAFDMYDNLWLCEVINPQIIDYSWAYPVDCLSELNIKSFWHNYTKHPNFKIGNNYICDAVKLIKQITSYNFLDYKYYGANVA